MSGFLIARGKWFTFALAALPQKCLLVVELLVDCFEMWVSDVGVNLSGTDVTMTQHGLHRA